MSGISFKHLRSMVISDEFRVLKMNPGENEESFFIEDIYSTSDKFKIADLIIDGKKMSDMFNRDFHLVEFSSLEPMKITLNQPIQFKAQVRVIPKGDLNVIVGVYKIIRVEAVAKMNK